MRPDIRADGWATFLATVARHPDKIALLQADREVSFAEALAQAEVQARALTKAGLRPGDRAVLHVGNSIAAATLPVAMWAIGATPAFVPPETVLADVVAMAAGIDARLIISDTLADDPAGQIFGLDRFAALAGEASTGSIAGLSPALGSIVFTSGSSGQPKGVMQLQSTLIDGIRRVGQAVGFGAQDRVLCPVPWTHDYGWGQLLAVYVLGITMILPERAGLSGIPEAVERHRPSVLGGMPSVYAGLTHGISDIRARDRRSLRLMMTTGATMPIRVLEALQGLFETAALSLNFGMTETFRTTSLRYDPKRDPAITAGRAIPGVRLLIVNDAGAPCQIGETGEIVHAGAGVFEGYWGLPEATARTLRPDPGWQGEPPAPKAVFSGDLGYLDASGLLFILDRKDRMVKTMGIKVSPLAVEHVLRAHPEVADVAVFALPHDILGAELRAAIVGYGNAEGLEQRLKRHVREHLSAPMQPRGFMVLPELPRRPSGKTDYTALLAMATIRAVR